jgi:hypothetical protein
MDRQYDTLQELFEDIVRHAPNRKPAKDIAAEIGKTHQVLLNESDPDCASHKLGVEVAMPIMKAAGAQLEVAGFVSREAGGVHMDLSRVKRSLEGKPAGDLMDLSLEAMRDFGQVAEDVRSLLAGGAFDPASRKRTTHSLWELIQVLVTLDLAVNPKREAKP